MENGNFARTAGLWCLFGAVIVTAGAIVSGLIPSSIPATDVSAPYSPTIFRITQLIWATCHLLTFLGTLGLARVGAAGNSRLGKIGCGIALVGMALIPLCEVGYAVIASATVDSSPATILDSVIGLASTLAGLGFVLAGIAVLRARRWQSWHRFVPLLCGLYVFIALTPILAALSGLFFWGLAGWGACFILLGLALAQQRAPTVYAVRSAAPA